MAQVSIDVAKESSIQSINNTITNNVADKQTLTTVSNKIGNFTGGGSLEDLVASLSTKVENLQTELAEVKSKVESSGGVSYSYTQAGGVSSTTLTINGSGVLTLYTTSSSSNYAIVYIDGSTSHSQIYLLPNSPVQIFFSTKIQFYAAKDFTYFVAQYK